MHPRLTLTLVTGILGFFVILAWRVQESRTPVTLRKIVIPPLGMATGSCMFLLPVFRVPWLWALTAFLLGVLVLAYPLIRTSRLTLQGTTAGPPTVMVQRSNFFFVVLVALALIRILAHSYLDTVISPQQTAGLFFLLAFGMILCWRASMFFEYRRLSLA